MGKVRRVMRCYNCGAILQNKHKKEPGYISIKAFSNANPVFYCDSCYDKIASMNKNMLNEDIDRDIRLVLKDALASDAVIIWVVDLVTFNGTLSQELVNMVKKLKTIVVGTKFDLLPKRTNPETIKNFIQERFSETGIKPVSIAILGKEATVDIEKLMDNLNKIRLGHDVYMIGDVSCGKTVLINKLLRNFKNNSKQLIKYLYYPKTSLKVLEIPFSNSSFLYELPGFSLNVSTLGKVEKFIAKNLIPKKPLSPNMKTLNKNEGLMVGSLGFFGLVSGKTTRIKIYIPEGVETKKIQINKLDENLANNYKKRLIRPVSDRFQFPNEYDLFEYDMENDGQIHDISISGLGWISFVATGQTIRVLCPKGVAIKESLGKLR